MQIYTPEWFGFSDTAEVSSRSGQESVKNTAAARYQLRRQQPY
jgi:hypothetical protein